MTNREKFVALVSKESKGTLERNRERIKNRVMLRESQQIAIKVLKKLNDLAWSQKDLAIAMDVSPQQINKIVKGQENLTLETQIKLQSILDIPILASYYENKAKALTELGKIEIEKKVVKFTASSELHVDSYSKSEPLIIKMTCNPTTNEYSYKKVV